MRKGFTLIELLVVVLIIGILAAVALPQYQKAVKKAQGVEVVNTIQAFNKGLQAYYLENGTMEGVSADNLNVQIPPLKHFVFQAASGPLTNYEFTSQDWQIGSGASFVTIQHASGSPTVTGRWKQGHITWNCSIPSSQSKPAFTCADYFNCNATVEYVPQVFSAGHLQYDAYYTGGNCELPYGV